MWSPPGTEGVLSGDVVVRRERPPSSGGGRAAQLRGGEADRHGAGAWPREAVRILLPGGVDWVPGTGRRVTDSRDVMIAGEVIRRRNILTVQWQRLCRVSGRLWVVHPGVLVRQVGYFQVDVGESNCVAHVRPPCLFPADCDALFSLQSKVQAYYWPATCAALHTFIDLLPRSSKVSSWRHLHLRSTCLLVLATWGHWPWFTQSTLVEQFDEGHHVKHTLIVYVRAPVPDYARTWHAARRL